MLPFLFRFLSIKIIEDLQAFLEIFYADDLTYATTSQKHKEDIKKSTPKVLKAYNLHVNEDKTEEGEAPDRRPPPPPPPPPLEDPGDKINWSALDWLIPPKTKAPEPSYKSIKLLGTKLDTTCDITSRKTKVWQPIKLFRKYFKSKHLSASHKIRIYRTYIEPLLLYNCETWILTTKQENSINSFHRRLLRIALDYRYPKIINNEKLYTLSNEIPLTEKIKKRRLNLLGHILRLHPNTPAQKALNYYMTPLNRPIGRPPQTWLALITKDLKNTLIFHNIKSPLNATSLDKIKNLAANKYLWRNEVARSMKRNL